MNRMKYESGLFYPSLFGFSAIMLQYIGRIFDLPGRAFAFLAAGLAVCSVVFALKQGLDRARFSIVGLSICGLCLLYGFIVYLNSDASQREIIFFMKSWLRPSSDYYLNKLLLFILSFFLPVFLATVLIFNRALSVRAIKFCALFFAAFVVIRVFSYFPDIARTDYETARKFYVADIDRPFSTVSYALILGVFCLILVDELRYKSVYIVSTVVGLLLFVIAWLNLRFEAILCSVLVIIFLLYIIFFRLIDFKKAALAFLILFMTAGGFAFLLFNDVNKSYWTHGFGASIANRSSAIAIVMQAPSSGKLSESPASASDDPRVRPAPETENASIDKSIAPAGGARPSIASSINTNTRSNSAPNIQNSQNAVLPRHSAEVPTIANSAQHDASASDKRSHVTASDQGSAPEIKQIESPSKNQENSNKNSQMSAESEMKSSLTLPVVNIKILLGEGLGSYAKINPNILYPHNVVFETYYELGKFATFVLISALLVGFITLLKDIRANVNAEAAFSLFLVCIFLLGSSLKAGDISNLGTLFFFLVIAVIYNSRQSSSPSIIRAGHPQ